MKGNVEYSPDTTSGVGVKTLIRSCFSGFRGSALIWVAILGYLLFTPPLILVLDNPDTRHWIVQEGGPVETLSWMGYSACLLYALYAGRWSFLKRRWYIHACFLLMGMRELDFDKKFTTMGILKSRFYMSADVPLLEKTIGAAFIIIIIWIVTLLIRNHLKQLLMGIRKLQQLEWMVALSLFLIGFSKTIDGLGRKFHSFGIIFTDMQLELAHLTEEIFELGIPLVFLTGLIVYFKHLNFTTISLIKTY